MKKPAFDRLGLSAVFAAVGIAFFHFIPAALAGYRILHQFPTGSSDGEYPQDAVTLSGSTLYGTTQSGAGTSYPGTIFDYNLSTGIETVDYAFGSTSTDGSQPSSGLVQSGALLFGTTSEGGNQQDGTLYSFNPATKKDAVMHTFRGTGDGSSPSGAPLVVGNTLYGTTFSGGNASGDGVIYSYNLVTRTESLLHAFTGGTTDGANPSSALIGSGGFLYGVTPGGGAFGAGTIFQLNTSNNSVTLLHSFGSNDGSPIGALSLTNGVLYGMTERGGTSSRGTIYSYNLTSTSFQDIHTFTGGTTDGDEPEGDLISDGSLLYGLTPFGGTNNQGTIFQINPASGKFQILYSFTGLAGDGEEPNGSLILANSTLYGVATVGGTGGQGVLFSLSVPEPSLCGLGFVSMAALIRRRRLGSKAGVKPGDPAGSTCSIR